MHLGGMLPVEPPCATEARAAFKSFGMRLREHVPAAFLHAAATGSEATCDEMGLTPLMYQRMVVLVGGGQTFTQLWSVSG